MIVYHYNVKVKVERPETQTEGISGKVVYRTITENIRAFIQKVGATANPVVLGNFTIESFRLITECGLIKEKDKLTVEHIKESAINYDGTYGVKSAFYYPVHSEYEIEGIE